MLGLEGERRESLISPSSVTALPESASSLHVRECFMHLLLTSSQTLRPWQRLMWPPPLCVQWRKNRQPWQDWYRFPFSKPSQFERQGGLSRGRTSWRVGFPSRSFTSVSVPAASEFEVWRVGLPFRSFTSVSVPEAFGFEAWCVGFPFRSFTSVAAPEALRVWVALTWLPSSSVFSSFVSTCPVSPVAETSSALSPVLALSFLCSLASSLLSDLSFAPLRCSFRKRERVSFSSKRPAELAFLVACWFFPPFESPRLLEGKEKEKTDIFQNFILAPNQPPKAVSGRERLEHLLCCCYSCLVLW